MANTDLLSSPFNLKDGDVLNSPAALAFIKSFILEEQLDMDIPDIKRECTKKELVELLRSVKNGRAIKLIKKELNAYARLFAFQGAHELQKRLLDAYGVVYCSGINKGLYGRKPLASIEDVGNDKYEFRDFSLKRDSLLRLYAAGEWDEKGMVDYGGIEDSRSGELFWVMYHFETVAAGGAEKNRKTDCLLALPAGDYRLHYKSG
ncbi:MAG: hypothetical protein GY757_44320, partial [bacterium]|nr:hypothetical protein [bacterium]